MIGAWTLDAIQAEVEYREGTVRDGVRDARHARRNRKRTGDNHEHVPRQHRRSLRRAPWRHAA